MLYFCRYRCNSKAEMELPTKPHARRASSRCASRTFKCTFWREAWPRVKEIFGAGVPVLDCELD